MPLEAPVTEHLDAAYRCSSQETFSEWLFQEGNS